MEVDEKAVLSFLGFLCTECLPASQVLWGKLCHKQFRMQVICEHIHSVDMANTGVQRGRSGSCGIQLSF
jgi:hypothetical protein